MKTSKVERAFQEMKENPPAILAKTRKKFGPARAEAQRVAIGLDKARRAGAKIRRRPSGSGPVTDKDMGKGFMHMGKC